MTWKRVNYYWETEDCGNQDEGRENNTNKMLLHHGRIDLRQELHEITIYHYNLREVETGHRLFTRYQITLARWTYTRTAHITPGGNNPAEKINKKPEHFEEYKG